MVVALRPQSKNARLAQDLGLKVMSFEELKMGDFIMVLLPDQVQGNVYQRTILPHLEKGDICFCSWT